MHHIEFKYITTNAVVLNQVVSLFSAFAPYHYHCPAVVMALCCVNEACPHVFEQISLCFHCLQFPVSTFGSLKKSVFLISQGASTMSLKTFSKDFRTFEKAQHQPYWYNSIAVFNKSRLALILAYVWEVCYKFTNWDPIPPICEIYCI